MSEAPPAAASPASLGRRALRTAGLTLALLALLGAGLVVFFEDSFIYFPQKGGVGAAPGADVELRAADGVRLHAWWRETPGARRAILHLHGNAGNLEHRRDLMTDLASLGASVLAVDYRGYGKSEGRPSEAGLYADARAAYDWLAAKVPASAIVLHGESLGAAVAVDLASRVPCAGLVVQSAFTSTPDLSSKVLPWFPARLLMKTRFDNLAKVKDLRMPKLFVHSRDDEMIPFEMAERLFAAAAEPKEAEWFRGVGHNDLLDRQGRKFRERVQRFLDALPE